MAVSGTSNLMTKPEVDARLGYIQGKLESMANYYSNKKHNDALADQIAELEEKEKAFFDALGISGDIDSCLAELQARLSECANMTKSMNGALLWKKVISAVKFKNDKTMLEKQRLIDEVMQKATEEGIYQFFDEEGYFIAESFQKLLNNKIVGDLDLGEGTLTWKGTIRSHSGYTDEGVVFGKLTKVQQRRTEYMARQLANILGIDDVQGTTTGNGGHITTVFTWTDVTNELTPTDAQKLDKDNPGYIDSINSQITDYICSSLTTGGAQASIRNVIESKILAKDRYAFFVGKNTQAITGILGEIQAVYFAETLFKGKANQYVDWVAKEQGLGVSGAQGKMLAEDLIVKLAKEKFGMQVKNTTKDFSAEGLNVNFISEQMKTFFEGVASGIRGPDQSVFRSLYSTYAFNIEYGWANNKAIATSNPKFAPTRANMESLLRIADSVMSLMASAMMSMAVAQNTRGVGNVLYIVGGTHLAVGSSILRQAQKSIQSYNGKSFSESAPMSVRSEIVKETKPKKGEYSGTIVDAINSGRVPSTKSRAGNFYRNERTRKYLSKKFSNNKNKVRLKASYLFKN